MTNFEKYRKQILDFIANNKASTPAIVNGKFAKCGDTNCSKCSLDKEEYHGVYCGNRMLLWLYEEYRGPPVDWSKVSVDDFNHLMDEIRYALEKYITGNKWIY